MQTVVEISTKWALGTQPLLCFRVLEGAQYLKRLELRFGRSHSIGLDGSKVDGASIEAFNLLDLRIRTLELIPSLEDGATCEIRGELIRAIGATDLGLFSQVLQVPTSRVKERLVQFLGGLIHLNRFENTELEFACRTIVIHRLLEEPALIDLFDNKDQLNVFLAEGRCLLEKNPIQSLEHANWSTIRWCCSLSMVTAYVYLIAENYEEAFNSFRYAAACLPFVEKSKVSALNVIQASFFGGLLGIYLGEKAEAERLLTQGVVGLQPVVACQNLLENVWVVGDLINVAKVSRHCYVALGLCGLVKNTVEATRIDASIKVSLGVVDGPMLNLVKAGRATQFVQFVDKLNVAGL